MAFPALEPTDRSYSPAQYPLTAQAGWAGGSVRFLHSPNPSGAPLRLGFSLLTATEAGLIRAHYRAMRGGAGSFLLGATAWAGHSSQADLVPAGTLWRYASPPDEIHRSGGLIDVSVELESLA